MIHKLIFIFAILVGLLLIGYPRFIDEKIPLEAQSFQMAWQKDVDTLKKPKDWRGIKYVKVINKSKPLQLIKDNLYLPVSKNPDGDKFLEILILDSRTPVENKIDVMIQYSLFDIETQELEWEKPRFLVVNFD